MPDQLLADTFSTAETATAAASQQLARLRSLARTTKHDAQGYTPNAHTQDDRGSGGLLEAKDSVHPAAAEADSSLLAEAGSAGSAYTAGAASPPPPPPNVRRFADLEETIPKARWNGRGSMIGRVRQRRKVWLGVGEA